MINFQTDFFIISSGLEYFNDFKFRVFKFVGRKCVHVCFANRFFKLHSLCSVLAATPGQ